MLTRTRISRDSLKQPNQESSDRATAYRIWPAKHKPVLQFPSEPQRQLPRAQGRRSPNQGASMPRSSVVLHALFPTQSGEAQTPENEKGPGASPGLRKAAERGWVNARTCPDGPRSSEAWGDCCSGADYSDAPRLDAANWTANGSIRVVVGSPECRKFSPWPVTGWL